jgi:cell division protein FtsQ
MPAPRELANICGRAARRSLPVAAATSAIALACGGVWLGYQFVTTSPRFAIEDIQVSGASHLTPEEVRAALPVTLGDNVFTANLGDITDRLRAHEWIASAEVHRILPHTLVVEIREHQAAAMVTLPAESPGKAAGSDLYLVDAEGHPFKRADLDAGDGEGLPIVTGIERTSYQRDPEGTADTVTGALAVLARWRAAGPTASRPAIGEINVDTHGGLTLRTYERGTSIQLGPLGAPDELGVRMRTFDTAWSHLTEPERTRTRAIHLDARPDHVTVAFAKD